MPRSFVLGFIVLLVFPGGFGWAAPQYHDYSQYIHWIGGIETPEDDITSITSCEILGTPYWATTGLQSGLTFFGFEADGPVEVGSLPLPGAEQGVVVRDGLSFVIAQPNRLTKVITYSPANPFIHWTDDLPGNPYDVAELGPYLLIACGTDGLLVYDPSEVFNYPVGVIGTWSGVAHEVQVQETTVVVRTDEGLSTINLSDVANPVTLDSVAVTSAGALLVDGDLAYLSAGDDVTEIDISLPENLAILRIMIPPYNLFNTKAMVAAQGGLFLAASGSLHFLDLPSGQVTWSGFGIADAQGIVQYEDYLGLAAGVNGFHLFTNKAPDYPPTSTPFDPVGTLKDMQIEGDFLFGYYSGQVSCYYLGMVAPVLVWIHESPGNYEYIDALSVQGDRVFIGYNDGWVRILEYTRYTRTELVHFPTGGEEVKDLAPLPEGYLAVFEDPSADVYLQGVVEIYDLADIANPLLVDSYVANEFPHMWVTGNTIVLWDNYSSVNGVRLLDATNPSDLQVASNFGTPHFSEVTVNGQYLYLVEPPILKAVDISNPYSPQIGPAVEITRGWFLEAHGQAGYLVNTDLVFDLSDPLFPVCVGSTNSPWAQTVNYCAAGQGYLVTGDSNQLVLMAAHSTALTPVEEDLPPRDTFFLQALPNPFNPQVTFQFSLPAAGLAEVEIMDVRGRRVTRLDQGFESGGMVSVSWDGKNSAGQLMPSGVYLAKVRTIQGQVVRKVVLAR